MPIASPCKFFGSLLATAAITAIFALPASAQDAAPKPPVDVRSFDANAIDKSIDPCEDFYAYACGKWIKENPVPADQTRWSRSFSLLHERNQYLLWQILDDAAKAPQSPLQKQYGDYYAACMDTAAIETKGSTPINATWAEVDKLNNIAQLASLVASLRNQGDSSGLFGFGVSIDQKNSSSQIAQIGQGGLSLPDRDYYLDSSARFVEIRAKYIEHIKKMFLLAGDSPDKATEEANAVLAIETALADISISRTEMRIPENRYHIYKVDDFVALAPAFDWKFYFAHQNIGAFQTLNVSTPNFFKGLNSLLAAQPLSAWKSYLRWHTLAGKTELLPKAFYNENFDFFHKTLAGQAEPEPRWKRCTQATDQALGEAVGQDWVARNFPPQAKASMDKLVAALDKSLGDDISALPWMSDETKKAAEEKLKLFRNKIGYPEKWRDYSSIKVDRTDALGNSQRASVYARNYNLAKLGKPVDEKEWGMSPPTVNAYYSPSFNDINFPAGILQPPFFDFKIDPAVNFGSIGVVIGHEMTHGFDDQGAKYDGLGNLRQWQTDEDRKKFEERTSCVADEYSSFEAAPATDDKPAVLLKGRLTLGENTADNGGLRIAYMALLDALAAEGKKITDSIDGYTEAQRYFIGFAQVWCQNQTDAIARQMALTDPHSPGKWRTNGSVQNFDEFGKAFNCKKGQPMFPDKVCRVW